MQKIWKTKLATWLHDPAEKALVLLRDKTGHEWGTVANLREQLFGERGMPADLDALVKRADWYASAADRPQFPREEGGKAYARWTQVDFARQPVLKHPLGGEMFDLGNLEELSPEMLKEVSLAHFSKLIVQDEKGTVDLQKTYLAYWRFGPRLQSSELAGVWENLPADTRIPDHSIWSHLDVSSAFAGAIAGDETETPALLSVSLGPVQAFIAEARSTSDLWAGSHLLARISWEAMKVVCEECGPDAILFPNLRGVPLVDVWLRDEVKLAGDLFRHEEWAVRNQGSDSNALFTAALPNRFVALVPASRTETLVNTIRSRVRSYVMEQGQLALEKVLEIIDEPRDKALRCYDQLAEQLAGFPEVYWAAVPWSLAEQGSGKVRQTDDSALQEVLGKFYPSDRPAGFLGSTAWKLLKRDIEVDGTRFYQPNPGTLYPAMYDLLDRVAAASKTVRPFTALNQTGYRSSLGGEREWLTLDQNQLGLPPGERLDTLWTRLAEKSTLVKPGEHLDAMNLLKRLWPTLFAEWVSKILETSIDRYMVSTHTLALAVSLERWLSHPGAITDSLRQELESNGSRAALPRRLLRQLEKVTDPQKKETARLVCRSVPGLLELSKDQSDQSHATSLAAMVNREILDGQKAETYYGLILFDGDRMGGWLAGAEPAYQQPFGQSWHPAILASVRERFGDKDSIVDYLAENRPATPSRHRAISTALNHFSLRVARYVIEDCYKGKLVYAGGDDVLALVCVDDLLPAMTLLRTLYSGIPLPKWVGQDGVESNNGFTRIGGVLAPAMGSHATASCGAVIAHHQAPLAQVMRQLREAEAAAKHAGGRNAFALRVVKRGGGEVGVTDKWFRDDGYSAAELLHRLSRLFEQPEVSRRAAYNAVSWLNQLEQAPEKELVRSSLAYQFSQQGADAEGQALAASLADYACSHHREESRDFLTNFLMVAEFLGRESRQSVVSATRNSTQESAA